MNWPAWLSLVLYVATLVGIFAGRNWLKAWIERGVQHQFDQKLEKLRGELRESEERLKSELRTKEAEIAALRDGALSGRTQRQALIEKRRIDAVERVWAAIGTLAPLSIVSELMARVDFKVAAELAPRDERVRQFAGMIAKNAPDLNHLKHEASNERPFVSSLAWAYFSAYQIVLFAAYMRAKALELGLTDAGKLFNDEPVKDALKAALPHQSEYIDRFDASAHHFLLEELREKLLTELQRMLRGEDLDEAGVAQAARIIQLADKAQADTDMKNIWIEVPEAISAALQ